MDRVKIAQFEAQYKFYIMKLKELGISGRYEGLYFTVYILELLIKDEIPVRSFYKDIYPRVAKKYNKNEDSIERDIRHLIKKVWSNGINSKLAKLWVEEKKPSCCKFIYLLKNYVVSPVV